MARKPRIHIEGAFYHVMLRGNAGQNIFNSPKYFLAFEELIEEGIERFGHRIHAYCWMKNHVHLAVEVGQQPLSKIIQNVSFRYTRWFNKKENQSGHLFQGRFKAILIEEDQYLLELVRYIHLNPVRAGLTEYPEEYPWSSHNTYIGLDQKWWLTRNSVLARFDAITGEAIKKYQQFVIEGIGEERRPEFHNGPLEGRLLGDEDFVQNILKKREEPIAPLSLDLLIEKTCAHLNIDKVSLSSPSRQRKHSQARFIIAFLYTEYGNGLIIDIARYFSRDIATISTGINRIRTRLKTDLDLKKLIQQILKAIKQ
jgi:putative transposase